MNGQKIAELKSMTEGEFRVFLGGQLEAIHKGLTSNKAHLCDLKKKQDSLEKQVVKLPPHCMHEEDFEKMCTIRDKLDGRLDNLEKEQYGRKMVNKVFLGSGVVGLIGIVLAIAKFIFEAF